MTLIVAMLLQAGDVAALVRELDHDDLDRRAETTRALLRLGETALPELERAVAGARGEARSRLRDLIEKIRWWDWTVWARSEAIDVRRGELVWSHDTERQKACVVRERDVFVLRASGEVQRRSLRDGSIAWRSPLGMAREELRDMGAVLVQVGDDTMRALDVATGAEKWRFEFDVLNDDTPRGREPSLVLVGKHRTGAWDLASGGEVWSAPGGFRTSVRLADGDVVVGRNTVVTRHRASDGKTLWSLEPSPAGAFFEAGPWIVACDQVGGDTNVIDAATGRMAWKCAGRSRGAWNVPGTKLLLLSGADGEHGVLRALDSSTWTPAWRVETTRPVVDAALREARLFAFDQAGDVRCLDPVTGREAWKSAVRRRRPGALAFDTGRIEVRAGRVIVMAAEDPDEYVESFGAADGTPIAHWERRR